MDMEGKTMPNPQDPLALGAEEDQTVQFQDLPTDALLAIFKFCDVQSLLLLSQTCKRINSIIKEDFVWLERSKTVNVTNQVSSEIKSRSYSILPCKERCRISRNWNTGRYKEKIYLNHRTKYMPWLRLQSELIWVSRGRQISALQRRTTSIGTSSILTIEANTDDVSRFVVKNGCVVSGGRDGSLSAWNSRSGKCTFYKCFAHESDITDVDYDGNQLVVSGSRDKTIKLWVMKDEAAEAKESVLVEDRIWTVALEPSFGGRLCCGTSGHDRDKSPLLLYDIPKSEKIFLKIPNHRHGAGVLHVLWEDPNTLLSCGYDGAVRMWDIRTEKCVKVWVDPHDVALYCLASDHNHSVLCGTAQHGRVQMWDKRHSKSLQMYFMRSDHSSPVYSLAFDPNHLFVALDQSFNMMDFSGFRNQAIDYRDTVIYTY